jgi:D-aspartate ligase
VTRATLTAFRNAASPVDVGHTPTAPRAEPLREVPPQLDVRIYTDLAPVEQEWRRFESVADCTAFQTFDWLAPWQQHVGLREGARPAIVVGRFSDGATAFLLPLCVVRERSVRRLCWLGQELCDYNAPLLAPDFSQRVTADRFLAAWQELQAQMQSDPLLRYDWIAFEKMPQKIGAQINPFTYLRTAPNASGAHLTQLGDNWEKFYAAKRSSSTRRRDRTKRRHLSEYGEIRFVTAADPDDARHTLETLMEQKSQSFARHGITDLFARSGHREFFLDLASNPKTQSLVHVSRMEIGTACAAANLGIVFRDCYYHVLASYSDSAMSYYGPGSLHLRELMAYAISRGLKLFDFTIGDESYKLEWSDAHVQLHDFATIVSWRALPARVASALRRRIKRFIKQTPFLWRWVNSVRSTIGSILHPHLSPPRAGDALTSRASPSRAVLACVMGDMDLLRPLALAGIPCAVVTRPGVPSLYSRHAQSRLVWDDFTKNTDRLIDALVSFGKARAERPVLFFEEDGQVLLVSRFRESLAEAFRFVVANAPLVEDLLDKARFQELAERHGLPVPVGRRFDPAAFEPAELALPFPLIIKPLTRLDRWTSIFGLRKALYVESAEALRNLWPQLRSAGLALLAQEFIPGAEAQIESYHCYVDQRGDIAGEFTGRKIRTYPLRYGHTTALAITDTDDVRRRGRAIVDRLALTGVAKLDFKRDPRGKLHLLEINPRFNLWHHPGAIAGVNIPALVYADLTGLPRPQVSRAKADVRWCRLWKDLPAARSDGEPLAVWLSWALGCDVKSSLSWDDPLPLFGAALHRLVGRHLAREQMGVWRGNDRIRS